MKRHSQSERRCSYLVVLDNTSRSIDELRELGAYLSTLAVSDFDVIVVDASFPPTLDCNRRVLRWVGRHILARPQHLGPLGTVDPIRAAVDLASCEKVIVADAHVRYSDKALEEMSMLLDLHEVIEPQDYLDPLPWWGGIEAGRILVHRSLSPLPDHGSTFAFRKRAIRGLRSIAHSATADDYVRRLASQGAEVFSAIEIFVRRIPPALSEWIRDLPRQADEDFEFPAKAAFFFGLLPVAVVLALVGGFRFAAAYAGAIAFAAFALAVRGRTGAGRFFPWRACLYAPIWVLERSITAYWALLWRVSGGAEPGRIPVSVRTRGERVAATGE
ncbi:MAG TPA: hypothetical protein VF975_04610 [Thermoanaerobaculia bacterium]